MSFVGISRWRGISPPAIVFVNHDLTDDVKNMLVRQLHINEVMDGYVFDDRVAANPGYADLVHHSNLRIMVVRSFFEMQNRNLADLVLFVKAGLASAEVNKFGPPGDTFQVVNIHWGQFALF
ncbi:MAG TPA: hypothetical protein VM577_08030 [Anaerovoracaceae bacterium]|nr:hypothetical protein [Anaerovoracaceae bacterium]